MNLFAVIAVQIVGGGAAAALDRQKPEWTRHVGKTDTSPGVAITPGAMAGVGLAILLAVLPGKSAGATAPMWRSLLANVAGGALVYEGVKLAENEVIPRLLKPAAASPQLPPGVNPAVTHGMVGNWPYQMPRPHAVTDFELQRALENYRRAA